ncbi:protein kinase [Cordyceps fumosorosea ARSEF 2679]|uniref:Protein kinase n=1 Tax=Cordyceps fumosorosea (strain ARSEF 2679) TaxID=1081104 RepID=A0A168EUB9_CORFA|nr:protein kinase [Cordyceps fumosorosea ARSEF 2679]OAA74236.1 protein kinase [Cordyceps fumosorosea ARSEF 2679]
MLGKEPYDPDVVAYLYGDSAEESIILLDAIEARNNPSTSLLKTSRTAKAITETLDAKYDEDIAASKDEDQQCEQAYNPCFTVTFSEPPKRKRGFVIGSDSNAADLAIKYKEKVSARQFALTFDKEHELVVEDLSSTNGTRVVYSCNNADEARYGSGTSDAKSFDAGKKRAFTAGERGLAEEIEQWRNKRG